ncbi:hypothetical protein HDU80_007682 [Chytriomyces hyalinus]|nr:hypothetical protein HDU80_007682 [Chytriomyces hyalinus]
MSVNRLEALMLDIDSSLGRLAEEEEPSDLGSPLSPAAGDPDKKGCTVNELLDTSILSGTLHWVPPIHQHNFKTEPNFAASLSIRRFFILSTDAFFMFASSAPTEQCLDVFKLSESLLMIANIQAAVALPLAFEIRDEVQSWILCAQTKTSKSLWMEMIHAVISKLPNQTHGGSVPNVALGSSSSIGGGSRDLRLRPTGPPPSPQHAQPHRNQSQPNSDSASSAPPAPPSPPPKDEMNNLIKQLESAKLELNAQIQREIINIHEQRRQISNPTSSQSLPSFQALLPHRSSDSTLYTPNQDGALTSASTRQSLPPYSLIERGNGSFINAGFGVSESDGDVSPIVPNSRMDRSRGGSSSGTTSAAATSLVARKKKKNKYPGVVGLDLDLLGA